MTPPSPEVSIAIGSAIIALSALTVSIQQLCIQRRHNKLSVKPHIDGLRKKHDKDQNFIFSFSIINNGLGPALIKSQRFYLDGTAFTPAAIDFAVAVCDRILKEKYQYTLVSHSLPSAGCVLKPSDEIKLIEVNFVKNGQFSVAQLEKDFQRVDLEIDYESFYGEKKTFNTKD